MKNINIEKICIHLRELLLLKFNKNVVSISKTTQNKLKQEGHFFS